MSQDSPYAKFQNFPAWKVIENAIEELIENQDLEPKTDKKYIIGYLIQSLEKKKCLREG